MGSLRDLVRNHGARGLLAGVTASAIRDAPYAGIFVLVYEIAKDRAGTAAMSSFGSG
jgi:solute carrier family 25 protein 38